MTISTTTNRVSYSGNGVTLAFAFAYPFFADSDLKVILIVDATGVETTQTLTTHYSVTGAGTGSGTVTMVTAPATGETLVIVRNQPYTQTLDLVDNDSMPAEELEQSLDQLVLLVQQVKDTIDRSFVLSDGDATGVSLVLPVMVASKLLQVKSDLSGFELVSAVDLSLTTPSAFIQTLLDDVDVSAARTTLALSASATVEGDIELATQAEVDAGTDTTRALTPATLTSWATKGRVQQVVHTQTGAVSTGTTVIPVDDTIPDSAEGDQIFSQAITPKNTANILYFDVLANASASAVGGLALALFQDSTAAALAVGSFWMSNTASPRQVRLRFKMTAGTTSATTFKIRIGLSTAGTWTLNGWGGARKYGGVQFSSMTITEVAP